MTALTIEQFKEALPPNMSKSVNPLLIMQINNIIDNPEEWESYRENLLSYTHVLQQGKFKLEQYINAVRYVGYKVAGFTNKDAYRKTFPERYERLQLEGASEKDISSYVASYNKSKLVMIIYEQTLIPVHILNAPVFQKAVNHQMHLMLNSKSDMVQTNAANSLMVHLKPPETKKMELDIGIHKTNVIDDYEKAMYAMVEKQRELIRQGGDLKQITNASIRIKDEDV